MWNERLSPVPAAAPPVAPPARTRKRPGWPEIAVAAVTYVVLVAAGIAVLDSMPDEQAVARGVVGYAVSALAGLGAFGTAVIVRVRDLSAFGLRQVAWKWLLLGAGLGAGAYLLNIVVSIAYVHLSGDTSNPQGDYRAAAGEEHSRSPSRSSPARSPPRSAKSSPSAVYWPTLSGATAPGSASSPVPRSSPSHTA